jgi:hypothetical protein
MRLKGLNMAGAHERKYDREFKNDNDKSYNVVVGVDKFLHVAKKGKNKCICGSEIHYDKLKNKDFMMYRCPECTK